ncbi:hypothetical protein AB0L57_18365 [Nocardia sp. NPDC052254]|uniref:hypothetical protein n=1 Tax=Nocardia sp. NPDC052254 TaxID=3155681 RepID=UPI003438CA38
MAVVSRVLFGSMLTAMLLVPAVQSYAAPVSIGTLDNASELAKPKNKNSVTVKCYLMNLRNEATGEVVYGTGRTKAEAQADANTKVPRGHKLKHCDPVR